MSSLPPELFARSAGGRARFSPLFVKPDPGPAPVVVEVPPPIDPAIAAYERGYAEGAAITQAHADAAALARSEAAGRIELAFARMDEAALTDLKSMLRQTVIALCEATLLPAAIDQDGLTARIEKAAGMLQRAQDEKRVLLHPDDLALVRDRLPQGLQLVADSSIERGGLRIETPDGGIEDGPSQWRRILAEAFREC
ncbi:hypothetical protein GRI97_05595 [Altererythrobacter xixiisoli]|uniref:Flagellar assembly protein FliH/Type III secretion system HrpE domain-containing protein n=1 Tax=Croceibacterium xixiisoli TaxID=1476466 RepID=A0A6I4TT03_9SPHN|nr:FliH/SctL family protein [Croceibacterium xixiisoli]MXO98459.1 hypothetical protein [Croceibacterium xixiisoli]